MSEGNRTVLVVDDDEDFCTIMRLALSEAGHTVVEAKDGKSALDFISEKRPDLIVLDLMMPEMNGVEFCRKMVGDLKINDVPILIVSAISEKSRIVEHFLKTSYLSERAFMQKPVDPIQIEAKVGQMLGAN